MAEIVNVEQAELWDGPSGEFWVEREDALNAALAPHTEHLLAAAGVRRSDRVLDVGCGTGHATRVCARRAIDGHVLGVDLSTAMLARARERAEAEDLRNVSFEQCDAQVHVFPAGAFDLLVSRFGVMFFADPLTAFANLGRATAPGGRFAAVVWQPIERNEWLALPRVALAVGRELPAVPEDAPGPFGFADPDRVRRILTEAGWSEVEFDDVAVPYDFGPDPEAAVASATAIAMLRSLLDDLDDDQNARATDALHALMVEHASADGVLFDSRIWVVNAVR